MAKEHIEREKALNDDRWNSVILSHDRERAREIILCQPAADVVEVVRCKDCLFSCDGFICNGDGLMRSHMTLPHKYCADGVRRDDNASD